MNEGEQTGIKKSLLTLRIRCSAIACVPLSFALLSLAGGRTSESAIFVIMAMMVVFLTLALSSFLSSVLLTKKG